MTEKEPVSRLNANLPKSEADWVRQRAKELGTTTGKVLSPIVRVMIALSEGRDAAQELGIVVSFSQPQTPQKPRKPPSS